MEENAITVIVLYRHLRREKVKKVKPAPTIIPSNTAQLSEITFRASYSNILSI